MDGVDSAVYGGPVAERRIAVGIVPDDFDDTFRADLEIRAAGPDLDCHLGGLTGVYGLDGAVGVERPLGPAACLVEFAVGTVTSPRALHGQAERR
jgi:hypothetical protein